MKPEVKIIQNQQIEDNQQPQIDSWEAEQLLRKYGYQSTESQHISQQPHNNMTFEEMFALEENKRREEELRKKQINQGAKPISFDGCGGYHTEIKYGSDEESGYGFKIQISSDMPLPPKY
jgi:hypothetical protein